MVQGIADPAHQANIMGILRNQGYPAALREFASSDDTDYFGSQVDGARCLAAIGDSAGAIGLLERGYQEHEGWMVFVQADPAFAALRSDPRFQKLIAEIRKKS